MARLKELTASNSQITHLALPFGLPGGQSCTDLPDYRGVIFAYEGIAEPGKSTSSMVETPDIFPTLCDLAGLPAPDFVDVVSLQPIWKSPTVPPRDCIQSSEDYSN